MTASAIDAVTFRHVMSHYPTGVCAITAARQDGPPAVMIVGSFTSVSLAPPLVAFFPGKQSSTWPMIESSGQFCVNVLADDQGTLCRKLSSKAPDKFANVACHPSNLGNPILDGALAWIDCKLFAVHEAGDHHIVIGHVDALEIHAPGNPLIFHKGNYGGLASAVTVSDYSINIR
ncbi:flavin reductase family protein [Sphingobium sp. TCM1]|uniref:flavin reductase family protein n=1 Tax=Sphingobium sp. TCM1 TaxID=453246 RepID=UPI0007F53FAA|nr:flavin reductase family protein [Sphingobium sp. TCM1]OAN56225.1 monooxygenase [Sphingobium sp. TCM1]